MPYPRYEQHKLREDWVRNVLDPKILELMPSYKSPRLILNLYKGSRLDSRMLIGSSPDPKGYLGDNELRLFGDLSLVIILYFGEQLWTPQHARKDVDPPNNVKSITRYFGANQKYNFVSKKG